MTDMTTATTAPKTLAEKLAAATALVAKLTQQIAAEGIKNDIVKGDDVSFLFGRGDKRRTLAGTVAGVRDDDAGSKIVAILVEGDDGLPETFKVRVGDVTENRSADARRTSAPAPLLDVVTSVNDATDPLNVA